MTTERQDELQIFDVVQSTVYMPVVLCQLIAGYVTKPAHRFNIDGFSSTNVAVVQTDETTTELICVDRRDSSSSLWRKFVSESTVADGHSEWTVETDRPSMQTGWMAFGLTVDRTNGFDNGQNAIEAKQEWMMAFVLDKEWRLMHNGRDIAFETPLPSRIRVCFKADPKTGIITVRGGPPASGRIFRPSYFESVLSEPRPPFGLLRPCVIVCGPVHVVVRSGSAYSADLAKNCESVVILAASM